MHDITIEYQLTPGTEAELNALLDVLAMFIPEEGSEHDNHLAVFPGVELEQEKVPTALDTLRARLAAIRIGGSGWEELERERVALLHNTNVSAIWPLLQRLGPITHWARRAHDPNAYLPSASQLLDLMEHANP